MDKLVGKIDWPVFVLSGGALVLFVLASFINVEAVGDIVNLLFGWSVDYFGAFWQVLLLLMLGVSIVLAFSKYGNVRLGEQSEKELSTFRWVSVICISLLGAGGVFWQRPNRCITSWKCPLYTTELNQDHHKPSSRRWRKPM